MPGATAPGPNKTIPQSRASFKALQNGKERNAMTLEEKYIDRLYRLLHKLERKDPDTAAVLRWAIFEVEKAYQVKLT